MIRTCLILLAASFILSSCLEELDEQERFIKVYGEELQSSGEGIRELPNGDLLIVGAKAISTFESQINLLGFNPVETNALGAPTITRIDRFGNVLLTRVFPMESIEINLGIGEVLVEGTFLDILPLSTGNFIAVGHFGAVEFPGGPPFFLHPFFVILDPDFNILELSISGEQSDFVPSSPSFIFRLVQSLHQFPDGNVGILFETSCLFLECGGPGMGTRKISILKLTPQGDTLWIKQFPEFQATPLRDLADHLTFDTNGDILVVGQRQAVVDTCEKDDRFMIVLRIDQNGNQMDEKVFGGTCEFHRGHLISPLSSGYAVFKRFVRPQLGEERFSRAITILDQNLEETMTFEDTTMNLDGRLKIDATQDGGYVMATLVDAITTDGSSVVLRTDDRGAEIWRYEFQGTAGDILETQDGGIVILINKTFNSSTPKAHILKLTTSGKI